MLNKYQFQPPVGTLTFQTQIVIYENRWSDIYLPKKQLRKKNLCDYGVRNISFIQEYIVIFTSCEHKI